MTFFPVPAPAPAWLRVSMFCRASIWKTNSLPSRRAGSPVQVSAGPSTANFTPAACSSSAIALVAFFAGLSLGEPPSQVTRTIARCDPLVHAPDLEVGAIGGPGRSPSCCTPPG